MQSKLAFTAEQVDSLDEVAARRLEGLIALITTFDQQYALVKQQESVAEFSDVAFWALDAMQQPDVAKRIGAQWRYIYVDECQIITPCRIDSFAKSAEMQPNLPWSVM